MTIPDFGVFIIIYAFLNVSTFFLYAHDKTRAKRNGWRIPENLLLFFALLGPFGACSGMQLFRHKTQKIKFYIVPLLAVLHGVFLIGDLFLL